MNCSVLLSSLGLMLQTPICAPKMYNDNYSRALTRADFGILREARWTTSPNSCVLPCLFSPEKTQERHGKTVMFSTNAKDTSSPQTGRDLRKEMHLWLSLVPIWRQACVHSRASISAHLFVILFPLKMSAPPRSEAIGQRVEAASPFSFILPGDCHTTALLGYSVSSEFIWSSSPRAWQTKSILRCQLWLLFFSPSRPCGARIPFKPLLNFSPGAATCWPLALASSKTTKNKSRFCGTLKHTPFRSPLKERKYLNILDCQAIFRKTKAQWKQY